jgi:chromosome segregation ATPase
VKGGFYSDTFQYYEKELETRAKRIADLEQQALEQSNAYKSEVVSLRAELTAMQAEYQLSAIVEEDEEDDEEEEEDVDASVVNSPETGNNATKAMDSPPSASNWTTNRKSINRKSFMSSSSSSGVPLTPMSNMDDLLSDYGQVTAKLKTTERDLEYYKQLAMDMVKAKTDETLAAREAATVAVQACMKRAEVEQELDDALFQLEESQKDCSRLNKELISEQQRNATLRTRIQKYAKELGKMEVSYVLSINPEEGSDQSSSATHRRR